MIIPVGAFNVGGVLVALMTVVETRASLEKVLSTPAASTAFAAKKYVAPAVKLETIALVAGAATCIIDAYAPAVVP
jgi:hypothetical protein